MASYWGMAAAAEPAVEPAAELAVVVVVVAAAVAAVAENDVLATETTGAVPETGVNAWLLAAEADPGEPLPPEARAIPHQTCHSSDDQRLATLCGHPPTSRYADRLCKGAMTAHVSRSRTSMSSPVGHQQRLWQHFHWRHTTAAHSYHPQQKLLPGPWAV